MNTAYGVWISHPEAASEASVMAPTNPFTGLPRKLPKRDTTRKKRGTLSSTVSSRMYAEQAMMAYQINMTGANMTLTFAMVVMSTEGDTADKRALVSFLLLSSAFFATAAMEMIALDSRLCDISPQEGVDAGYYKELQHVTLDSYSGDDECAAKTRFAKAHIREIVDKLDLPETIRVYYHPIRYYKFMVETLVIYMLRKMSTARTHVDLANSEFGGCPKRWGTGYNYIVHKFDRRFRSLIGPTGLRTWAPYFPQFAEVIRKYLCRPKARVSNNGDPKLKCLTVGYIPPNGFNVFSFTDCSFYEICCPGSGPKHK